MENVVQQNQKDILFQQTYINSLLDNKKNLTLWKEYKEKYEQVIKNLKYYNEKHQHSVFLPVGNKAYVKGKLVHTNDVWVTLGCGWFLKTSSKKAIEICERRIKSADELIEKCEKESKLLENMREFSKGNDAFESEGTKEIVETFDEDEERQWQLEHRESEKKYRQQLKELKEKTGTVNINTENDIWEHLEALELQEELEDELNRLGCDTETSSEDDEDSNEDVTSNDKIIDNNKLIDETPQKNEKDEEIKSSKIYIDNKETAANKKTVSFNLPSDNKSRNVQDDSNKVHENSAISDTVYENVPKRSLRISDKEIKRPMSKFRMNRQ